MGKKKIAPPNYTAIPNCIFPLFPEMKEGELRVILVVCRETFGWHRSTKEFSISELMTATGMKRQGTCNGISDALKHGLLERKPTGQSYTYSLNIEEPELVHQVDQSTKQTSPPSRPELVHQVDQASPLSGLVVVHQVDQQPLATSTKSKQMQPPKERLNKGIKKGKKSSARTNAARRRNEFSDAFCTVYASLHFDELEYSPQQKDFVQLAALRKADTTGWLTAERWQRAIDNYFASGIANPTLADLSVRFRVFYKSPLDRFGKAIECAPVGAVPTGCARCLPDPVRIRTATDPGWRYDTTARGIVRCECNQATKETSNGKPQRPEFAATIA